MIGTVPGGADTAHVVVTLPGPDLDLAVAGALSTRFRGSAEDPQTVIVVDLSAVTFMDCAGPPGSVHASCSEGRVLRRTPQGDHAHGRRGDRPRTIGG